MELTLTQRNVHSNARTANGLSRSCVTCRVTYKHTQASSRMYVIYVARLTLIKARCSNTSVCTRVKDHITAPSVSKPISGPQITVSISVHTLVKSRTSVTPAARISSALQTCGSMSGTCTPMTSPSHARTAARPSINPLL